MERISTGITGGRLSWILILLAVLGIACSGSEESENAPAEPAVEAPTPEVAEPPASEPEEASSENVTAETDAPVSEDLPEPTARPTVTMTTAMGSIKLELMPEEAPKTVENFLQYARDGFFDGTIFHRVMPGFVIQGGGFNDEMIEKQTRAPIQNEADNGVKNLRGTICMARTPDPHSATSQFFINTKDNAMLDFRGKNQSGWGYAVFGRVTEGMEVVEAIEKVPTTRKGMHDDVPADPVVIESVRLDP